MTRKSSRSIRSLPCNFSRARLKNVDRSSATYHSVTVNDVTVVITEFKPKVKKEKKPAEKGAGGGSGASGGKGKESGGSNSGGGGGTSNGASSSSSSFADNGPSSSQGAGSSSTALSTSNGGGTPSKASKIAVSDPTNSSAALESPTRDAVARNNAESLNGTRSS